MERTIGEAFERIEAVARENEVLKGSLAELRERYERLRLGVGQVSALIRLAALVREWGNQPSPELEEMMKAAVAQFDLEVFGPEGPSELDRQRGIKPLPSSEPT